MTALRTRGISLGEPGARAFTLKDVRSGAKRGGIYVCSCSSISNGLLILGCAGCASPIAHTRPTLGDQLPMYGEMDRQDDPLLKEADRQLIEGGSR